MSSETIVFWLVMGGGGVVAGLKVIQVYGEEVVSFVLWCRQVSKRFKE